MMTASPATGTIDQEAYRIAVASIRRHSMDVGRWKHTVIGELHPGLVQLLALDPGELTIASAFLSTESWSSMAPIYGCMFWTRVVRFHHAAG